MYEVFQVYKKSQLMTLNLRYQVICNSNTNHFKKLRSG